MGMTIDVLDPQKPKRIAVVASNSSVSKQTGWPIGFWWSELTHPYWEFVEHGYQVEIFSPDGASWKRITGATLATKASIPRMI